MTRNIHFADHLELQVAVALDLAGIEYTHESEVPGQVLDFHLSDYSIYIEVKQYFSEKISKQLKEHDEVIVLQGKLAVDFFTNKITQKL